MGFSKRYSQGGTQGNSCMPPRECMCVCECACVCDTTHQQVVHELLRVVLLIAGELCRHTRDGHLEVARLDVAEVAALLLPHHGEEKGEAPRERACGRHTQHRHGK